MMLELVDKTWFVQGIFRGISAFFLILVAYRSIDLYYVSKKKTLAAKYLMLSFVFNATSNVIVTLIAFLNAYGIEPNEFITRLLIISNNVLLLLAADYSVHFVARSFYAKHSPGLLSAYDMSISLIIGMIIGSFFDSYEWSLEDNIQTWIIVLLLIILIAISFTVVYYSFKSASVQTSLVNKRAMQFYGAGVLVFVSSMIFLLFLIYYIRATNNTSPVLQFLSDNLAYIITPINTYLMYVGCFRPKWFVARYDSWWIANVISRRIKS